MSSHEKALARGKGFTKGRSDSIKKQLRSELKKGSISRLSASSLAREHKTGSFHKK